MPGRRSLLCVRCSERVLSEVERFTTTDALFKFTRMIDVKWASPTPAMPNGRCRLNRRKVPRRA